MEFDAKSLGDPPCFFIGSLDELLIPTNDPLFSSNKIFYLGKSLLEGRREIENPRNVYTALEYV
jgi:hypothetical protein